MTCDADTSCVAGNGANVNIGCDATDSVCCDVVVNQLCNDDTSFDVDIGCDVDVAFEVDIVGDIETGCNVDEGAKLEIGFKVDVSFEVDISCDVDTCCNAGVDIICVVVLGCNVDGTSDVVIVFVPTEPDSDFFVIGSILSLLVSFEFLSLTPQSEIKAEAGLRAVKG